MKRAKVDEGEEDLDEVTVQAKRARKSDDHGDILDWAADVLPQAGLEGTTSTSDAESDSCKEEKKKKEKGRNKNGRLVHH